MNDYHASLLIEREKLKLRLSWLNREIQRLQKKKSEKRIDEPAILVSEIIDVGVARVFTLQMHNYSRQWSRVILGRVGAMAAYERHYRGEWAPIIEWQRGQLLYWRLQNEQWPEARR